VLPLLQKSGVADLALPVPLVALSHPEDTLFRAVDLLSERRLLSAPVLAPGGGRRVLAVLDALDVVAYVARCAAEGPGELRDAGVDEVAGLSRGGQPHAEVGLERPLDEVASIIGGPARRAVVVDAGGRPHSVITQSTLLQFLHGRLGELEALQRRWTAQDLCSPAPVCVADSESALSAFQTIRDSGVSSVAVVDEEGAMVTVASATDLVVWLANSHEKRSALKTLHEASIVDVVKGNRELDYKARPDQPLESVLEKLAKTRVHRVIVCSKERKPLGVLSLTDICRAAAQQDI